MHFRDAVVPAQVTLRLTRRPAIGGREVLNSVDMCAGLFDKPFAMVNAVVLEAGHVKGVVDRKAVGVDDRVGLDLSANNRHERSALEAGRQRGVDAASSLEDAKDHDLACGPATAFSSSLASEVAFIKFDLALERALTSNALGNSLAELVVVERSGVAVHPNQLRSGARWRAGDEVFGEPELFLSRELASSSLHRANMCT